MFSSSYVNDYG